MKNNLWKWALLFSAVFITVLVVATPFFLREGFGWMPMMGWRGYTVNTSINWIGGAMMIGLLVIPVIFIGLVVVGVVALVQRANQSVPQAQHMQACTNCGKFIQADWKVCPHCGTKVKA